MTDPARPPTSTPPKDHPADPAGSRRITPPAWREHFAGPILQPGERYEPAALGWFRQREETARTQARPASAPGQPHPSRPEPVADAAPQSDRVPREGFPHAAKGRQTARLMRPLAADAAVFAARALDLGAKGLAGLAARLDERRGRDEKPRR
jgi:hypothetical protein